MEVNDSHDWASAANNMGKWYLGVEKGAEKFEDTWQRENKRNLDRRHKREAAVFVPISRLICVRIEGLIRANVYYGAKHGFIRPYLVMLLNSERPM